MTTEEKAKKYDEIEAIVLRYYPEPEDGEIDEFDESHPGLLDLGEDIAIYFGFL